jgi:CheY-like chemotaxis protein
VAQLRARILIVNDEPAQVCLPEDLPADKATGARYASDSRHIEGAFEEVGPCIDLLDLQMPCIDGRQVLRRLKGLLESLGFTPLVVVTADASRVARSSALVLGADDFLSKPLERAEVMQGLRLLQTRKLFTELAAACLALERDDCNQPET